MPSPNEPSSAVRAEQPVVAAMYDRLDELTSKAARDLNRAKRAPTAGTPAAQVEREAMIRVYTERVGALVSAERQALLRPARLLRGGHAGVHRAAQPLRRRPEPPADRLARPGGRAVLPGHHRDPDRRGPAPAHPARGPRVTGSTTTCWTSTPWARTRSYEGNGALMAALAAQRTGRMGDIVATIQAEQDRIIRAPMPGILVVEGGPGCGKTVVGAAPGGLPALHAPRPDRPQRRAGRRAQPAVPALHRARCCRASARPAWSWRPPASSIPGSRPTRRSRTRVAVLKGDLRMAEVVAAAVRARQRVPDSAGTSPSRGPDHRSRRGWSPQPATGPVPRASRTTRLA